MSGAQYSVHIHSVRMKEDRQPFKIKWEKPIKKRPPPTPTVSDTSIPSLSGKQSTPLPPKIKEEPESEEEMDIEAYAENYTQMIGISVLNSADSSNAYRPEQWRTFRKLLFEEIRRRVCKWCATRGRVRGGKDRGMRDALTDAPLTIVAFAAKYNLVPLVVQVEAADPNSPVSTWALSELVSFLAHTAREPPLPRRAPRPLPPRALGAALLHLRADGVRMRCTQATLDDVWDRLCALRTRQLYNSWRHGDVKLIERLSKRHTTRFAERRAERLGPHDWDLIDTLLLCDPDEQLTIITPECLSSIPRVRPLALLTLLVARAAAPPHPPHPATALSRWLLVHQGYLLSGREASLVLLQRRWHRLKAMAREARGHGHPLLTLILKHFGADQQEDAPWAHLVSAGVYGQQPDDKFMKKVLPYGMQSHMLPIHYMGLDQLKTVDEIVEYLKKKLNECPKTDRVAEIAEMTTNHSDVIIDRTDDTLKTNDTGEVLTEEVLKRIDPKIAKVTVKFESDSEQDAYNLFDVKVKIEEKELKTEQKDVNIEAEENKQYLSINIPVEFQELKSISDNVLMTQDHTYCIKEESTEAKETIEKDNSNGWSAMNATKSDDCKLDTKVTLSCTNHENEVDTKIFELNELKRKPEINSVSEELLRTNKRLLEMCKPVSVVLTRLKECEIPRRRVVKRVDLSDIDEVRRTNTSILTAEVKPTPFHEQSISLNDKDNMRKLSEELEALDRDIKSMFYMSPAEIEKVINKAVNCDDPKLMTVDRISSSCIVDDDEDDQTDLCKDIDDNDKAKTPEKNLTRKRNEEDKDVVTSTITNDSECKKRKTDAIETKEPYKELEVTNTGVAIDFKQNEPLPKLSIAQFNKNIEELVTDRYVTELLNAPPNAPVSNFAVSYSSAIESEITKKVDAVETKMSCNKGSKVPRNKGSKMPRNKGRKRDVNVLPCIDNLPPTSTVREYDLNLNGLLNDRYLTRLLNAPSRPPNATSLKHVGMTPVERNNAANEEAKKIYKDMLINDDEEVEKEKKDSQKEEMPKIAAVCSLTGPNTHAIDDNDVGPETKVNVSQSTVHMEESTNSDTEISENVKDESFVTFTVMRKGHNRPES